MKQIDPNTVSGLLKLHLREHPFLSQGSITKLDKAMNGDKVGGDKMGFVLIMIRFCFQDQILSEVVFQLASSELNILTDIVELLYRMVQDPWRVKNKMTAHTLGIACGLSLFPQLDPSKATLLTELLIIGYNKLRQSHTMVW